MNLDTDTYTVLNEELKSLRQRVVELEQQLINQQEVPFRMLVQSIDNYEIIMLDPEGYILTWNEGAELLKGYTAQEIIGKHFSCFYGIEDINASLPKQTLLKAINEGRCEIEGWRFRKNGSQFWANVVTTALKDEKGQLLGFSKMTRDVTDRHYAQEALQQKTQQLEAALKEIKETQAKLIQSEKMSSLGQLVAGIAHEVNNPINFIHGNILHANEYTENLLNLIELYTKYYPQPVAEIQEEIEEIGLDFLVKDLPKLLSSMKVGAERIRQIVLSLRNFSRLDEAEHKAVDVHEGIDNTLLILQHRFKEKVGSSTIKVVKNYGNLPLIECYAGQLNQVFMNIINNGLDALEEYNHQRSLEEIKNHPSIIKITTEVVDNNWVQIRIADNGYGIPKEVQKRLFDPFFTTKSVGKGTGLGLSISYQIVVEKHKGDLQCISAPGEGSEFVIKIPIKQQ